MRWRLRIQRETLVAPEYTYPTDPQGLVPFWGASARIMERDVCQPPEEGEMSDRTTLTLDARVFGRRRPFAADWQVLVALRPEGGLVTLRDLLAAVVASEVEAFRERQQERRL